MTIPFQWATPHRLVVIASDGRSIPADPENADFAALLSSGAEIADAPLAPPDYVAAVQARVDAVARERGFDNDRDAASYATSTVALWAAEAAAFVAWRDAAWLHHDAEAPAGPTVDALFAGMPPITWPEAETP